MSLKSKLTRMKKHLNTDESIGVPKEEQSIDTTTIPYLKEWKAFDAQPYYFEGEYIFIRERKFPLQTMHGLYELGTLQETVKHWNDENVDHPLSAKGLSCSDLFFFDTETTGLGTGTGNTIFLLGYARVFSDHVALKQLFLPGPSSEVALYHYFLSEVDYNTLVTYNGKAFDWPQVKTRHTLIRDQVPKLPQFGHFDLLHASRRLWKSQYDSLKLSIVEKELLNIKRDSDTPGFMAPMIYFHFLEDHNPEGVFEIMKHNETDILTLITLYVHISNKVLKIDENITMKEQFEVARWMESVGNRIAAIERFEYVADSNDDKAWDSKLSLAELLKKEQNIEKAVELWEELFYMEEPTPKVRMLAGIELAKYYEHKQKDIQKALSITLKSKRIWLEEMEINPLLDKKKEQEFNNRILRLNKKVRNMK